MNYLVYHFVSLLILFNTSSNCFFMWIRILTLFENISINFLVCQLIILIHLLFIFSLPNKGSHSVYLIHNQLDRHSKFWIKITHSPNLVLSYLFFLHVDSLDLCNLLKKNPLHFLFRFLRLNLPIENFAEHSIVSRYNSEVPFPNFC